MARLLCSTGVSRRHFHHILNVMGTPFDNELLRILDGIRWSSSRQRIRKARNSLLAQ